MVKFATFLLDAAITLGFVYLAYRLFLLLGVSELVSGISRQRKAERKINKELEK